MQGLSVSTPGDLLCLLKDGRRWLPWLTFLCPAPGSSAQPTSFQPTAIPRLWLVVEKRSSTFAVPGRCHAACLADGC